MVRHVHHGGQALVDTDGRALVLDPQPADVQDRDGAVPVLKQSRRSHPFIAEAFADAGYAGDRPASATLIAVEIVRKPPGQVFQGSAPKPAKGRALWNPSRPIPVLRSAPSTGTSRSPSGPCCRI